MNTSKKLFILSLFATMLLSSCNLNETNNSSNNLNSQSSLNSEAISENLSDSSIATNDASSLSSEIESSSDTTSSSNSNSTPSVIYVTAINLNASTKTMNVGESFNLTYDVLPSNATNKSVTFDSSVTSVASVTSNGKVTALKAGTTTITVKAQDGSNISATCNIIVSTPVTTTWDLIKNTNDLQSGDEIVLGCSKYEVTAGDISLGTNYLLASTASTFASDKESIKALDKNTMSFTLGKNGAYWTLTGSNGKLLGATAAKKVGWNTGTTTWTISIDSSGAASITNSNQGYGTLYYNNSSPRFTTYTTTSQNLPQIYRGKEAEPIFPTAIEVIGSSSLAIGETEQLSVNFTPINTNQKSVTWSSSNTAVASISSSGLVTALSAGSTTITATAIAENGDSLQSTLSLNVHSVAVTGVTLNTTSAELGLNKTMQLTATVQPNNATNKNVTWSSSNNTVASVTQQGVVEGLTLGSTVITAKTADGNYEAKCNIEVKDIVLDRYTVMIYICGADLESESGLATANIEEILSVNNMPEDVNVIIETGGAKSWKSKYGISSRYLQRWHVENKQLIQDDQLTRASMGLTSTFQSFMEWGLTDYPAEKTGVVLWNHGGGIDGCCYDENYNDDPLTNSEVYNAFKNAFKTVGHNEKLSWIGYDCCLMAVADTADLNSDYFDYMISSQESEPGEGWDYDQWLNEIYRNPNIETTTLLEKISDTFVDKCAQMYNSDPSWRGYNDATMSVLDLSLMPSFRESWENMSSNLLSIINSTSKWNTFKTLVNGCQKFGVSYDNYDNEFYPYDVFDMKDFIDKMKANSTYSSSGINQVETVFNDLVIYNVYGADSADASGLCLFLAISGYSYQARYSSSDTRFTNWRQLNIKYGSWY